MCICMSTELKADLMGSVVVELSHGSVMHHRTLGSHDSHLRDCMVFINY